ncbi:hypothetical protein Barb4_02381 [Bacteroidales bacterium Barb4]|nr:hypothetical protein Barb4_02381 [Bacteroidales bacterium Barb4]
MKSFVFLFLLLSITSRLSAQEGAEVIQTIFDSLEKSERGKGNVVIRQPALVRALVGSRRHGENVEKNDDEAFLKLPGYRTQVFSGNNQRMSKEEAFEKEREIRILFPDVSTYVSYMAPFWKLRVGDFRTSEEADRLLRRLTEAFPTYGKEMYIVKEEIRIPLH